VLDAAEGDSKKRVILKMEVEGGPKVPPVISVSKDGSRVVFGNNRVFSAYRLDAEGLQKVWGVKEFVSTESATRGFSLHPTEDLLWTGEHVLEFSTGRVLAKVDHMGAWPANIGLNQTRCFAWMGPHTLATSVDMPDRGVDGTQVGIEKGCLRIYDALSGKPVLTVSAPFQICICASPDGSLLAEGGLDKRVRIRNGTSLEVEYEFRAHDDKINAVAWHPELPLLATVSNDKRIRIWNLKDRRKVEEFQLSEPHYTLKISPDGRRLISGDGRGLSVFEPKSFAARP